MRAAHCPCCQLVYSFGGLRGPGKSRCALEGATKSSLRGAWGFRLGRLCELVASPGWAGGIVPRSSSLWRPSACPRQASLGDVCVSNRFRRWLVYLRRVGVLGVAALSIRGGRCGKPMPKRRAISRVMASSGTTLSAQMRYLIRLPASRRDRGKAHFEGEGCGHRRRTCVSVCVWAAALPSIGGAQRWWGACGVGAGGALGAASLPRERSCVLMPGTSGCQQPSWGDLACSVFLLRCPCRLWVGDGDIDRNAYPLTPPRVSSRALLTRTPNTTQGG